MTVTTKANMDRPQTAKEALGDKLLAAIRAVISEYSPNARLFEPLPGAEDVVMKFIGRTGDCSGKYGCDEYTSYLGITFYYRPIDGKTQS